MADSDVESTVQGSIGTSVEGSDVETTVLDPTEAPVAGHIDTTVQSPVRAPVEESDLETTVQGSVVAPVEDSDVETTVQSSVGAVVKGHIRDYRTKSCRGSSGG